MLTSLTIQNIVLIEHLDVDWQTGLSALTGETGAGKSILLDSIGLILGKRADSGLVRSGADFGQVTAQFDIDAKHPVTSVLSENDLPFDNSEGLIIRRRVSADGKSKAYVNDTPVGLAVLKSIGAFLVEIHGQFDTSGLLDPIAHLGILDTYAAHEKLLSEVSEAYSTWRSAEKALAEAHDKAAAAAEQEDYIRHSLNELRELAPETGEEESLTSLRSQLIHRSALIEGYNSLRQVMEDEDGLDDLCARAMGVLSGMEKFDNPHVNEAIEAMSRAQNDIHLALQSLERLNNDDLDARDPNEVSERLFALKDCARKHNVTTDELPSIAEKLEAELALVDDLEGQINALEIEVNEAKKAYVLCATKLTDSRIRAAEAIEKSVAAELPDLKLEKAVLNFEITTERDDPAQWGKHGMDSAEIIVATNPGSAPGPLAKVASGGELARFTLALKVVLADVSGVPTLIFDEVDSGIGGATADAVGSRLKRLSDTYQTLVVTHSPQVAAKAAHHFHVAKTSAGETTTTSISALDKDARREEVARMLAGQDVTDEARAAADKLMVTDKAA